jgi:hypothetical protein
MVQRFHSLEFQMDEMYYLWNQRKILNVLTILIRDPTLVAWVHIHLFHGRQMT